MMPIALLQNWSIDFSRHGVRLTGEVYGHPDHVDGTKISTKVERRQFHKQTVITRTVVYKLGMAKSMGRQIE